MRMPRRPRIPEALCGEIFRGSEALRSGLITRRQLTAVARRLFRDVYADSTVEVSHAIRCRAVLRFLLPQAVVTGASAAYLLGIRSVPEDGPVELLMPVPHGPIRGVLLHHGPTQPGDVLERDGLRVASPARACWDLVLHRPLPTAMIFVDQFVRAGLVSRGGLEQYAWERNGERGWRLMLRAAQLADAGAESSQESRIRILLVESGVPTPVTQYAITERGCFVARTDLAWPDYRVAMEYDGYAYHSAPADLARDRARLNRQAVAGWIVIHATAGRLREDLSGLVAEVLAALRSRGWPGPPRL
jgi:hypothetical protein